jgi:hypothetical protein
MKLRHYIEVADHGRILRAGSIVSPSLDHIRAQATGTVIEVESPVNDCNTCRYDGSEAVYLPPFPSDNHVYDYAAMRWVLDAEKALASARARRDSLLAASDWVILRAQERGEPVPPEWLAYRQALRDITQQGVPWAIVWPTPPIEPNKTGA